MNFHSSFTKLAPTVKQTLYFCGGGSKTIEGIITSKIKQSEYTQLTCTNGVVWSIDPKKVNYFKTVSEGDNPLENTQATNLKKIYHFSDGSKLCLDNISGIKQGEFIKLTCTDGVIWSVNPENLNCFENITQNVEIKKEEKLFFQYFLDKNIDNVGFIKIAFKEVMPLFVGDFLFPNKILVEVWKIEDSDLYNFTTFNHNTKNVDYKSYLTQQEVLSLLEETLSLWRLHH